VNASTYFAQLYAKLCAEGKTVNDYLEAIYVKYGYYITKNKYYLCYDPVVMKSIFDAFRNKGAYPKTLGSFPIANIRDLTIGYDDRAENKVPNLPISASTQMITLYFANGAMCTLRGSGTEPKLKYYIEFNGKSREETLEILLQVHKEIVNSFLQPAKYGLIAPAE
jgi:phosphomannomutase